MATQCSLDLFQVEEGVKEKRGWKSKDDEGYIRQELELAKISKVKVRGIPVRTF